MEINTLSKAIDFRKKILIGEYFIHKATENNNIVELYKEVLNFLTRDDDKKLFVIRDHVKANSSIY